MASFPKIVKYQKNQSSLIQSLYIPIRSFICAMTCQTQREMMLITIVKVSQAKTMKSGLE